MMVRSPGWGRAREGHGSEGESPKGKGAVKRAQASRSPAPHSLTPSQNVPFIAVTSFLCLRFVSPAILAPKLFHLRERHADARTSRTLLLLAKVRGCGSWRKMPSWVLDWGPCHVPHCVSHRLQERLVAGRRCPPAARHFIVFKAFSWSPSLMIKGTSPRAGGCPRPGRTTCWENRDLLTPRSTDSQAALIFLAPGRGQGTRWSRVCCEIHRRSIDWAQVVPNCGLPW